MMTRFERAWLYLVGTVVLEILSFFVFPYPVVNGMIAIVLSLGLLILTLMRPTTALAVLSIEYLIGSKGALFTYGAGETNQGGVSIRVLFFCAFMAGWALRTIISRGWRRWYPLLIGRKGYVALGVCVLYATFIGWIRGNGTTLFVDANAWLAWALLLPAIDLARSHGELVRRDILPALFAGLIWVGAKTVILLFLFSHGYIELMFLLYHWVRRTGVGEITRLEVPGSPHRIFFQSHIYALFTILWCSAWAASSRVSRSVYALWIFAWIESIVALSRSFWMGLIGGGSVLMALVGFSQHRECVSMYAWVRKNATVFVASALFLVLILAIRLPGRSGASLADVFSGRQDVGASAVVSRWQLLPELWKGIVRHPILGSGFGATVTYHSQDPRIVEATGGVYTTYAFEWGWLEHWFKFGIVGIPLIAWILYDLGHRMTRSRAPAWIRRAVLSSIVLLAITHFFTPYLNHPLGIVSLIAAEMLFELYRASSDPSFSSGSPAGRLV